MTIEEIEVGVAAEPTGAPPVPRPANKPVRQPLPAHLPRELIVHAPLHHEISCTCPACGGALKSIGEDVSEMLE